MAPITAEEMFAKDKNLKREDIEHLREWLLKQPHLPTGITDEQLILFLHCCQHSLEASKQTIEAYCTIRTHAPELFANRDSRWKELQKSFSILEMATVPNRDQHGNIVMAVRLVDEDASKFSFEDSLNGCFILQDLALYEQGAVPGFVFVIEVRGSSLGHVTRVNLSSLNKYYKYIQEAFPGNVVATHLVNANSFTEMFMNMSKQFLNKDLTSKIFVHTSCEALHQHVTKDALPKEFGGNLDSMTSYNKMALAQMERHKAWLVEQEKLRVDESRRPGKAKSSGDEVDMGGSFRKLDID